MAVADNSQSLEDTRNSQAQARVGFAPVIRQRTYVFRVYVYGSICFSVTQLRCCVLYAIGVCC
jgi:hypothetical protein